MPIEGICPEMEGKDVTGKLSLQRFKLRLEEANNAEPAVLISQIKRSMDILRDQAPFRWILPDYLRELVSGNVTVDEVEELVEEKDYMSNRFLGYFHSDVLEDYKEAHRFFHRAFQIQNAAILDIGLLFLLKLEKIDEGLDALETAALHTPITRTIELFIWYCQVHKRLSRVRKFVNKLFDYIRQNPKKQDILNILLDELIECKVHDIDDLIEECASLIKEEVPYSYMKYLLGKNRQNELVNMEYDPKDFLKLQMKDSKLRGDFDSFCETMKKFEGWNDITDDQYKEIVTRFRHS